jgi:acyl carrier protein
MGLSQDEIFEKVQEALVDALGVDDDEVNRGATLVGDLGAESIDFLDIVFKLEKSFDINIERTELAPEDILTNGEYVKDGVVTADGMAELKRRMPWADMSQFEQNPRVQDFGNLLTVGDLCSYVGSKVGSDA